MAFGSKGRTGNRRPSQGNALFKRKKFCRFTAAHVEQIDYKDIDTLRDFIQENGSFVRQFKQSGLAVFGCPCKTSRFISK